MSDSHDVTIDTKKGVKVLLYAYEPLSACRLHVEFEPRDSVPNKIREEVMGAIEARLERHGIDAEGDFDPNGRNVTIEGRPKFGDECDGLVMLWRADQVLNEVKKEVDEGKPLLQALQEAYQRDHLQGVGYSEVQIEAGPGDHGDIIEGHVAKSPLAKKDKAPRPRVLSRNAAQQAIFSALTTGELRELVPFTIAHTIADRFSIDCTGTTPATITSGGDTLEAVVAEALSDIPDATTRKKAVVEVSRALTKAYQSAGTDLGFGGHA